MLERQAFDVLISGGGPAGMGAAIQALKHNKRVCLVTNRSLSEFTREQKVGLDHEVRIFLMLMYHVIERKEINENPEDLVFLSKLRNSLAIPIQEVERYLARRVTELDNSKGNFVLYENSELVSANLATGEAEIRRNSQSSSNQTSDKDEEVGEESDYDAVSFKTLIAADGVKHHAVDLVNKNLSKKEQITYGSIYPNPHKYHASLFIPSLVSVTDKPIGYGDLNSSGSEEAAIKVNESGLYQAIIFAKRDDGSIECNVNCEIKKDLFLRYQAAHDDYKMQLPNVSDSALDAFAMAQNELLGYMEEQIKKQLNRQDVKIDYNHDANGFVKLNIFNTVMQEASKAYVLHQDELGDHILIIMGDAFRPGYYHTAKGMNHTIMQVENLQAVITSEDNIKEELKEFNNASKKMASDVSRVIFAGTLFRRLWNKTDERGKADLREHREQVAFPALLEAAKKRDFKKIVQMVQSNPDVLISYDREKNNILHLADLQTLNWLKSNYKDRFYLLLGQQNTYGISALANIMDKYPKEVENLFPTKESATYFRDYGGNTLAHIVMEITNLEGREFIMDKIYGIDPNLFLVMNDQNSDAIDYLKSHYLRTCYDDKLVAPYAAMLTKMRGWFTGQDNVMAKLDDIERKGQEKRRMLQPDSGPNLS